MVCEKGPDSKHNFKKDPLKLAYENDWLTAHGTTLGADNGIGIALCMALVEDKDVSHPPLELLFTVEEETGLKGAIKLKPSFIKGKILINIDSEGEGVLTIGSAGGTVTLIDLPIARNNYSMEFELFKLQVSGLRGGHSGLDINRGRANPIKIMASVLDALNQKSSIRIVNLEGGSRVNAIPENATASLAFDPTAIEDFREIVSAYQNNMRDEYASSDSGLSITLIANGEKKPKKALTQKDTQNIISLIKILPDGVFKMSTDFEGNVETSNNLGTCHIKQNNFVIMSMERSADMNKINELNSLIQSKANEVGAKAKVVDKWSAWEPNRESALLRQSKKVYNATLGRAPKIEVIHAGLECSVINAKIPKIDMIAIGPTIENAHSVNERLFIPSVEKEWAFLTALLASYGQ
jgi:dipeptidase D